MDIERRDFLRLTAGALTFSLAAEPAWAQTSKTEVHWLGQATTKITSLTGKVIVIDPFLTNNPKTPVGFKNLDALGKVDVILVTHGHGDHTGDVAELAKRTGATVLGSGGLIQTMVDLGWVAPEKAVRFGKGGKVQPAGPQTRLPKPGPSIHPRSLQWTQRPRRARRIRPANQRASSSRWRTASSSTTWATRGSSATCA